MAASASRLPARPSIEQHRKQAKELLRDFRAADAAAGGRLSAVIPRLADPAQSDDVTLADAQFVLAREYGFENWAKLVHHVEAMRPEERLEQYGRLAEDLLKAYNFADPDALQRLSDAYLSSVTVDQLRANVQKSLGALTDRAGVSSDLTLDDAQLIIARLYGFESWAKFAESINQPPDDAYSASLGLSSTPPFYKIDRKNNTIEPRPPLSNRDWDTLFGVMKEQGISGLNAGGVITDAVMERLHELDQVTRLNLGGAKRLTDTGLLRLARMPQLQELDLSDYPGGQITDRGLEF